MVAEEAKVPENKVSKESDPLESIDSFRGAIGNSWIEPLKESISSPEFITLFKYVKNQYNSGTCYPPKELIFNAY